MNVKDMVEEFRTGKSLLNEKPAKAFREDEFGLNLGGALGLEITKQKARKDVERSSCVTQILYYS